MDSQCKNSHQKYPTFLNSAKKNEWIQCKNSHQKYPLKFCIKFFPPQGRRKLGIFSELGIVFCFELFSYSFSHSYYSYFFYLLGIVFRYELFSHSFHIIFIILLILIIFIYWELFSVPSYFHIQRREKS